MAGHILIDFITDHNRINHFPEGVTAGVIGLIAVTAIQLFISTITAWVAVLIFGISLLVLYRFPSRFTPALVILGAGVLCLVYYALT